jgi:hypothetical protein
MEISDFTNSRIRLPQSQWEIVVSHCRRKLQEDYLEGESKGMKAFGLIAGLTRGETIEVKRCLPLLKNARSQQPFRDFMDKMMTEHAVPSITPLEKRGWVADSDEMASLINEIHQDKLTLLGTYHMHRVSWNSDSRRDTPTKLDTVLAADSRMLQFIISMVDPENPVIRCFYEGKPELEIKIVFSE